MRKYRCILYSGLLLLLAFFLTGGRAVLAAEEEYTYTVRLYAGNQGRLTAEGIEIGSESADIAVDGNQIVISGLKYGDLVSIRPQDAAVSTDARYYVKGVRRSGRDNSEAEAPAFYVGSDRDFVVAYAVSGNLAAYTVNYVDMDGGEIMESDTYYGNVGERQYVSSRYVDGYQPQALNMVRTLSANEAENVFTFVYVQTAAQAAPGAVTEDQGTSGGEQAGAAEEEGQEDAPGQQIEDEEVPLGGDANARQGREGQDAQSGQQIEDEEVPLASGQEFLKDIDDEEVPLGTYKDERKNTVIGYLPVYAGIGGAALLVLLLAAVLLRHRNKNYDFGKLGRKPAYSKRRL